MEIQQRTDRGAEINLLKFMMKPHLTRDPT